MPRANRYFVENQIYHLTHRCHDRMFLLRFARDRDVYREWLREAAQRFRVSIFAFCVTSNHVHLLAGAVDGKSISQMMDLIEGAVAGHYNRRKQRSGAFWTGRYHATLIDTGDYLWNCLKYVELNMVRARVVKHPQEWRWNSYAELMGQRERYRILAIPRLLDLLGGWDEATFRKRYNEEIEYALQAGALKREGNWSECIAVGSEEFIQQMSQTIEARQRLQVESAELANGLMVWTVNEAPTPPTPYGSNSTPKAACSDRRCQ